MVPAEPARTLGLLLENRETLPVLCYVALHPKSSPTKAIHEMRIGLKTWYSAVRTLEDLGLVAGARPLGGKKVRYFALTREGREAVTALNSILLIVSGSKSSLKAELLGLAEERDPERVGEILCQLLLHAEREADRGEILGIIALAKEWGQSVEVDLGAAMLNFIGGDPQAALVRADRGLKGLPGPTPSRTRFKLLQLRAASQEYCGDVNGSARTWHQLRKEARKAGNLEMVVDAHVGLGILLARADHVPDALKEFEKGLQAARQAKSGVKEAKVLSNLAMAEFLVDMDAGAARSAEALEAALSSGARLTLAWVRCNRALMFALQGQRAVAVRELSEARRLFEEMGHERGMASFEDWSKIVKQTRSRHHYGNQAEWRDQVLRSLRIRPTPPQAKQPGPP